jgi:D-alanyl-D-alanine carboxypeptidase
MLMKLRHNLVVLTIAAVAVASGALWLVLSRNQNQPNQTNPPAALNNSAQSTPAASGFSKTLHSTTDPASIWVVVNKKHPLKPASYTPADLGTPNVRLRLAATHEQMKLRKVAHADLTEMFNAAKVDGVSLVFGSGFRSQGLQRQFYDSYVAKDGQAAADTYSARPGYSEHQTGLAVDFTNPSGKCHLETCWEETPEGKWVAANAYKYGFIMRYTPTKQNITGYQYEPWHFRYVGKELANEMRNQSIETLEEFFNITGGTSY